MLVLLFWQIRPDLGLWQSALVLVAWTHGCIGIHYWLRMRPWYRLAAMPLYTAAILLPVMALLGFAQAGRHVSVLAQNPQWVRQLLEGAQVPGAASLELLTDIRDGIWMALAAMLAFTLLARAVRQWRESALSIRIQFMEPGPVDGGRGTRGLRVVRGPARLHPALRTTPAL